MNIITQCLNHLCRCFFGIPDKGFVFPASRPVGNGTGEAELLENYEIEISIRNHRYLFIILKGFRWDGASIPSVFWPIVGHPMEEHHSAGSLLHDCLYRSRLWSRHDADWAYAKTLAQSGFPYWKIVVELIALRKFGAKAWIENSMDDNKTANAISRLRVIPLGITKESKSK